MKGDDKGIAPQRFVDPLLLDSLALSMDDANRCDPLLHARFDIIRKLRCQVLRPEGVQIDHVFNRDTNRFHDLR